MSRPQSRQGLSSNQPQVCQPPEPGSALRSAIDTPARLLQLRAVENTAALEAQLLAGQIDMVPGEMGFPLEQALAPFDAWITGRKRFQSGTRAALEFFEPDGTRLKINPLACWTPDDVRDYMDNNRLPRHPLVAKGYASIGCAPCTARVTA